jgi:hypothetical protein
MGTTIVAGVDSVAFCEQGDLLATQFSDDRAVASKVLER